VLIDAGNGMAGYVVPKLFKGLKVKHDMLYGELDGTFPNHIPNPVIPENTKDLQKLVKKKKYDMGIAYDADCDRVFFIDEKGNRVRSDHVLVLFAQRLLKKKQKVVYSINMSKIIKDKVEEMGGTAVASRIGHTEIPLVMKKHKAIVGGEITGHFYFKSFKYADSGDIGALMMLAQLSETGMKMSELVKPLQKYSTSEETNFLVKNKQASMNRVEKAFKGQISSRLDGLSIDTGDYWFNLRLSLTENYVRLNAEAYNNKKLKECVKTVSGLLKGR